MRSEKLTKTPDTILAIECAVGWGSVAVLSKRSVIASTTGTDFRPSRAEEILQVIDHVLKLGGVSLDEIRTIAVSTGPGSYSGIRIGMATALGLKQSLGVDCIGVPVLDAMAISCAELSNLITAIPVGKKDVAWQAFNDDPDSTSLPELAPEADFLTRLDTGPRSVLCAHTDLTQRFAHRLPESTELIDAGTALAEYIGRYAASNPENTLARPIYLRNRNHTGRLSS